MSTVTCECGKTFDERGYSAHLNGWPHKIRVSVNRMYARGWARTYQYRHRLVTADVPVEAVLTRKPISESGPNAPWAPARAVRTAVALSKLKIRVNDPRGILLLKAAAGLVELTPDGEAYVRTLQARITEQYMIEKEGI